MEEDSKIYELLLDVKKGNSPGWGRQGGYDDLVYDIRFNEKSPGLSVVTIVFEDYEEFFNLFEDLTEDDIWQLKGFMSHNSDDYGYGYDSWSLKEEWERGHIYSYYFNNENRAKIDIISSILFKSPESENTETVMELIYDTLSDRVESILYEWGEMEHDCRMDAINKMVMEEFGNLFYFLGIREVSPLYKYKTSVNVLLKLFQTIGRENESITNLFKRIVEKFKMLAGITDYSELYWEVGCNDFDMVRFNNNVEGYIDQMVENLRDSGKYTDIEEYVEIKDLVNKEFGFNKWNTLKRDSKLQFKITEVVPETNKIMVVVSTDGKYEPRSMTYDELMRFDGQHELFNEIRKIKNFFNII